MSRITRSIRAVVSYVLWWFFPRWSEDRFISKVVYDVTPLVIVSVAILGAYSCFQRLGLETHVTPEITIATPNGEFKCTLEEASKAISELEGGM